MISFVKQEQHYRSWAEVKWNVFSNLRSWMAVHLQFLKPTPLYLAHSDNHTIHFPTNTLRVRPQNIIDNLRQIFQMRYVVDFRALRKHGPFIVDSSASRRLSATVRANAPLQFLNATRLSSSSAFAIGVQGLSQPRSQLFNLFSKGLPVF